jgi:hypothetical protein
MMMPPLISPSHAVLFFFYLWCGYLYVLWSEMPVLPVVYVCAHV